MSARPSLKRALTLAQVGLAAGFVARAKDDTARELALKRLAEALASARGLPHKVGQLIASASEEGSYEEALRAVPCRPLSEIREQITASLGIDASVHFAWIDPNAVAASIGQVHPARLRDGRKVAIKVRHPDIASALATEIALLGILPARGRAKAHGLNLDAWRQTIATDLERELDFGAEGAAQEQMREGLRDLVVIPRVLPSLSGEGVLVMSYEPGEPLSVACGWDAAERSEIAETLIRTFFRSLFGVGRLHADPNPGNILFRRSPLRVVMLDFGATAALSPDQQRAMCNLVRDLRELRSQSALRLRLAEIGFCPEKLSEIEDLLPTYCSVLLAPLLQQGAFDLSEWKLSGSGEDVLGPGKWWFRAASPPSLLPIVRAFAGLARQISALSVCVDWAKIFDEETAGIALASNTDPQAAPEQPQAMPAGAARWLTIEVYEGQQRKVRASVPARQVLHLEAIMPQSGLTAAESAGINLTELGTKAAASGFAPQTLIDWRQGEQRWRLWLEGT